MKVLNYKRIIFLTLEKVNMSCECGSGNPEDKIVGGANVAADAYLFHTLVTYSKDDKHTFGTCSGSLINNLYVISSSQCVEVSLKTPFIQIILLLLRNFFWR